MKYALAIIIVVALGLGGWIGVGTWRRNSMLDSGKPLLLVNPALHLYTYSDLMERDDITSDFKIIGFSQELSEQQIKAAIRDYQFVNGIQLQSGDPRMLALGSSVSVLPNEQQQAAWSKLIQSLMPVQQTLCAAITDAAISQPCLARHAVFNAWKAKAGAAICASLYIEAQRMECETDLATNPADLFLDTDNDLLIDVFEELAVPSEQRVNDRNLPVINPGG